MAIIIQSKKLNRLLVTDTNSNSTEPTSYGELREILIAFGFSYVEAVDILGQARLNFGVFIDTEELTYRVLTNSERKFNPDGLFNRMFNEMSGSNNLERFDQSQQQLSVKDFFVDKTRTELTISNRNKGGGRR